MKFKNNRFEFNGDHLIVDVSTELLTNVYAKLSLEDIYLLTDISGRWSAARRVGSPRAVPIIYASVNLPGPRGERSYLHKTVLWAPPTLRVMVINGDHLDCRRENLRVATVSECIAARPGYQAKSGFKGVDFTENGEKFIAQIQHANHSRYLGTYDTAEQAARAYDVAALEAFGPYSYQNFPKEDNNG